MKNIRWQIAQWFEKNWWNNYLRKKNTEKYLEWKKDYWHQFLAKTSINLNSKNNILDIGCGPAGTFILSSNNIENKWIALDPLIPSYEKLDIFNQSNYSNVDFITNSFENYTTNKKFDIIFCINAINHFKNIEQNILKITKLMTNNSKIILSIDTHNFSFLKWLFYYIPLDILHPHQYTEIEYEKKFKNNGFSIENKVLIKKEFIFSYYLYILIKK